MKLSEFKKYKDENTKKVSQYVVQFAFAGIAVIWIFNDIKGEHLLPAELMCPLILLIASLSFTLIQVVYAGIAWSIFYRYHEKQKKTNNDPDVLASKYINWPTWFLFGLKIIALVLAYVLIVIFLADRL